ncbi:MULTISPECIES: type II toxin-antitoxin system RelE/ParE family toxin [unclassified Rhizobium]|uniref:type II toxin-antitoxin system RelE/ParE family toxin n=1 Tax=unclassified Rhizobium TaxID=2613769 RepID=UPI003804A196
MILAFSNEAENDLEQIADQIARDTPRRTLSFVRELRSKCEDLIDSPDGFAFVPRHERHGIRRRVHGNYLIFYRVESANVASIPILHGGAPLLGD